MVTVNGVKSHQAAELAGNAPASGDVIGSNESVGWLHTDGVQGNAQCLGSYLSHLYKRTNLRQGYNMQKFRARYVGEFGECDKG